MEQVTTNRLLSFNKANTSRKTMMLMDEPTKRYMCPVSRNSIFVNGYRGWRH
jgi:hypothetical protein